VFKIPIYELSGTYHHICHSLMLKGITLKEIVWSIATRLKLA